MNDRAHTSISISTGTIVRAILVLIFFYSLWILRDLLLIILTSIVIASFIESAIPHLRRIGFGRIWAIVLLYAVSILTLLGAFYLFAPILIIEVYNFSAALSSYVPGISFLDYFQSGAFSGAKDIVAELSKDFSISALNEVSKNFIANLSGGFIQTLTLAFGSIFNLVSIVLISFYLSVQERGIEMFLRLISPEKYENYIVDLWDRSSKKIAFWVKGQMLLGLVVAILIYLLLSLLGVQYALLLAIIAGVLEMVPYGTIVALIPAISFSYFSGGVSDALMVTGAYLIVHQFEVFLFAPVILKKVVGLSPIVIIIAALAGFELAGAWGVVLAIPVAVIIMEFISDIEKDKLAKHTNG